MKIWIAVCRDRHLDEDVTAHSTRAAAIDYARQYMREHVARPESLAESDNGERWDIEYEYESDSAFVVSTHIDQVGDPALPSCRFEFNPAEATVFGIVGIDESPE